MTFSFHTLGCKLNFAESSAIGKVLLSDGHKRASSGEQADICIVNTCSVTDVADSKGRQLIRRLHRENPDACIIVTGCYAQLRPDEVSGLEGVNFIVGANDKEKIREIVKQTQARSHLSPLSDKQNIMPEVCITDLASPKSRLGVEGSAFHPYYSTDDRTRCFLKVQDGCDYYCTYCTIPMARGRSRNASIEDTVRLAQQAIQEGAKELILTGVNIGDFGRSTGESFIDLLRALNHLEAEFRIRISSCEPNLLSDEIIDFVADSVMHDKAHHHFTPHFHIPLQSGSDEMLKIMHRKYDTALFAERVARIKERMPDAFIGVDCMVGLRGETEKMFSDYADFIQSLPVSQLHVFPYSERAGTQMVQSDLPRVDKKEQKRRVDALLSLSEYKLKAFYASQKGKTRTVLWEAKVVENVSERSKEHKTGDIFAQDSASVLMSGWTENYVRIYAPYDRSRINTFEKRVI